MRRLVLGLSAALAIAPLARPWGAEGHAAIGLVAEQNLSPEARRHVEQILGNADLAAIASWMDELRAASGGFGPLAGNVVARQFAKRFPHSDRWHYDDLPLGEAEYRDDDPFARKDDVVHELNRSIDVLEGRETDISPRIALYMLVHFVGDLHQPLHVACGFYDVSDPAHPRLLTDPAQCAGHPDDKGGNVLRFGPDRWDELHGYWDTGLVIKLAHSRQSAALAKLMMAEGAPPEAATAGDYHHWAEAWATESIRAARIAYSGITFGAAELNDNGGIREIAITLPPDYDERALPVVRRRLTLAGYRLAALVNALHWAQ